MNKNGQRRYKYITLERGKYYFAKKQQKNRKSTLTITKSFIKMLGFVLLTTYLLHVFFSCATLLVDLFLYVYNVNFIQGLLKKNE